MSSRAHKDRSTRWRTLWGSKRWALPRVRAPRRRAPPCSGGGAVARTEVPAVSRGHPGVETSSRPGCASHSVTRPTVRRRGSAVARAGGWLCGGAGLDGGQRGTIAPRSQRVPRGGPPTARKAVGTPRTSARRSLGRRSAPLLTPGHSRTALTRRDVAERCERTGCATLIACTGCATPIARHHRRFCYSPPLVSEAVIFDPARNSRDGSKVEPQLARSAARLSTRGEVIE